MSQQRTSQMDPINALYDHVPEPYHGWLFIPDAATAFDYSFAGYIGQLVRTDKVEGKTLNFNGRNRVLVNPVSLQAHKDAAALKEAFGGKRTTIRRFVLRIDTSRTTVATVQALLEDNLPKDAFTLAKPKYYSKSKTKRSEDSDWMATVVASLTPAVVVQAAADSTAEGSDEDDDFLT